MESPPSFAKASDGQGNIKKHGVATKHKEKIKKRQ